MTIHGGMNMHMMKNAVCAGCGVVLSALAQLFGGWDAALGALLLFMAADYVTGMTAAAVFHRSKKTADGTLESRAGWKGLVRKGVTLAVVLAAARLDAVIGSDFIRDAAVIGFTANEGLSIIENAGLMGVPVPRAVISAVHVLKERADTEVRMNGGAGGADNAGARDNPGNPGGGDHGGHAL